jgi:hypothetical protein
MIHDASLRAILGTSIRELPQTPSRAGLVVVENAKVVFGDSMLLERTVLEV